MASIPRPRVFEDLDDTTAESILRVQLQDVNDLLSSETKSSQKPENAEPSQWLRTLNLQKQEICRSLHMIRDRRISNMYAVRLHQDTESINAAIEEERQAERDHAMACRLGGLPIPPPRAEFANMNSAAATNLPVHGQIRASTISADAVLPTRSAQADQPSITLSTQEHDEMNNSQSSLRRNSSDAATCPPTQCQLLATRTVIKPQLAAQSISQTNSLELSKCTTQALESGPNQEHTEQLETKKRKVDTGNIQIEPVAKIVKLHSDHRATLTSEAQSQNLKRAREIDSSENLNEPDKRACTDAKSVSESLVHYQQVVTCIACEDDFPEIEIVKGGCGHSYCRKCIQVIVQHALVDESLYPPRCCKVPFTIDSMRSLLTAELISDFHQKNIEYNTQDRVYCSTPECSAFLYPVNIQGDQAHCPMCFGETCTICKGKGHIGDCPQDNGTQQVLALAEEHNWRRCNICNRVVELSTGCNHITCICKAEWCYVCGVKWKQCECPRWDEQRLVERAARDVERQAEVQRPNQHNNCTHDQFRKIRGQFGCDACRRRYNAFINRCTRCHIGLCFACLRHR